MKILLLCLLALLSPQRVTDKASPTFKGTHLGMSLAEFRSVMAGGNMYVPVQVDEAKHGKVKWHTKYVPVAGPYCADTELGKSALLEAEHITDADLAMFRSVACAVNDDQKDVAGKHLTFLLYFFYNSKLDGILGAFSAEDYDAISEAFTVKYGEGHEGDGGEYENIFGAQWKGVKTLWDFGDQHVALWRGTKNDPTWWQQSDGVFYLYDSNLLPPKPKPKVDF